MEITHTISAFFALLAAVAFTADNADAVRPSSCARLADIAAGVRTDETRFETTAQVIDFADIDLDGFYAQDSTGAAHFGDKREHPREPLHLGATYRLKGVIHNNAQLWCDSCTFVSNGVAPPVGETTAERFLSGAEDNRRVKMRGVVRDTFRDENDPRFLYMPLLAGGEIVYATFISPADEDHRDLMGAEILATGICSPVVYRNRLHVGRTLHIGGDEATSVKNIQVLRPSNSDPFDVPELENLRRESPSRIPLLGRRRESGRVIAVWGGKMLIETRFGEVINVELAEKPAPAWGTFVDVVGFPETDLFRINLVRAIWRYPLAKSAKGAKSHTPDKLRGFGELSAKQIIPTSAREIMTDAEGRHSIDPTFHGKTIRIAGRVATVPNSDDERLCLECDNYIIPVELPAGLPWGSDPAGHGPQGSDPHGNLVVGCVVEATGVCVMETENWRPNSIFPRMKGFFLVVQSPSDVRILSRPSWWTPRRLLALVCLLVLTVIAVLVWNRSLKRLSEERGRKLSEEQMETVRSELKYLERTNLATELHDAISQNLTGISMELRALNAFNDSLPKEAQSHLSMAAHTVSSCRNELRNVLHDLRNNALESATMDEALKIALAPHVGDAELTVRFSAPRSAFTEKSAHAILHIVRELVTNAVRHGGARHIRVAGAFETGTLKFSVTDDGCGFDPAASPGADEGHFGLQGVHERVETAGGEITIESSPGHGSKFTISLPSSESEKSC